MAKIFVGFPTYDRRVDIEILKMMSGLPGQYQEHTFAIDFIANSIITDSRNFLVKRFLESDFEYLYFWDSDVVIRDYSFIGMLLQTMEQLGAGIVGGAYRIKHNKGMYAAGMWRDDDEECHNFKLGDLKKPQLCDVVATGAMLIKREVLETLEEPWFQFQERKGKYTISEDFLFCLRAKEKGFKVAIDPRFATYHFGHAFWEHQLLTEGATS